MNCAERKSLRYGYVLNSRSHSEWVCSQIPNTHFWAFFYWSLLPGLITPIICGVSGWWCGGETSVCLGAAQRPSRRKSPRPGRHEPWPQAQKAQINSFTVARGKREKWDSVMLF